MTCDIGLLLNFGGPKVVGAVQVCADSRRRETCAGNAAAADGEQSYLFIVLSYVKEKSVVAPMFLSHRS